MRLVVAQFVFDVNALRVELVLLRPLSLLKRLVSPIAQPPENPASLCEISMRKILNLLKTVADTLSVHEKRAHVSSMHSSGSPTKGIG